MILASSALVKSAEFEIDGDQSELDLFSKYYQETGDDLLELEGVKQTRFGMSTGNLSQRRQALIRIVYQIATILLTVSGLIIYMYVWKKSEFTIDGLSKNDV